MWSTTFLGINIKQNSPKKFNKIQFLFNTSNIIYRIINLFKGVGFNQIIEKHDKLPEFDLLLRKDFINIIFRFFDSCSLAVNKNSQKTQKLFCKKPFITSRLSPKSPASYLIPLSKPIFDACDYTGKNSIGLAQSFREIILKEDDYLVRFDAKALLPSISL